MTTRLPGRTGSVRRFVVVGGGISGLAAARLLAGAPPVSEAARASLAPASASASPAGDDADIMPAGGTAPGGGTAPRVAEEAEVVLVEGAPRLGGKILTGAIAGTTVELGPDQFLRRDPSAERLVGLLGLGNDLVPPAAREAAVYSRGKLCRLPAGLVLGVPTDAVSLEASGILSAEGLAAFRRLSGSRAAAPGAVPAARGQPGVGFGACPGADLRREEIAELPAGVILRALVGDEAVDRLVDPLLGGINAGSIDALSLASVAPQIAKVLADHPGGLAATAGASSDRAGAQQVPSPFLGLSGGLSRLVAAIRRELETELGITVLAGRGVAGIARSEAGEGYEVLLEDGTAITADGVVIAVPGPAANRLLRDLVPTAASLLGAVPYASVAVATIAFQEGAVEAAGIPPGWSGVLVPRVEGAVMTAASFLTAKWPWMSGTGDRRTEVVRVSAGRYLDDRIGSQDNAGLSRRLLKELSELIGVDTEPSEVHLQRWDRSFPQYLPGHGAAVAAIRRALSAHRGLAVAGAVLGGIGVPACISSGERAAEQVVAGLGK